MKNSIISILTFALFAASCSSANDQFSTVEGAMLGTSLRIVADVECAPATLYTEAMALDERAKAELSLFDPSSLLSRINRGESDSLSEGLIYNLHLSDSVSRISGGAYDVTVAPLVKALGFGAKEEQMSRPNIDSILEFVGYEKIRVEGKRLIRQDRRTQIDLNSIAKGYTVDQLAAVVEGLGAKNYMVDIGGEIVCHGSNPHGEAWRIGIESPFDGNMSSGDYIENRIRIPADSPLRAMATSGNYRRYYIDDEGKKVAHTINPKTGESVLSTLLSATVIAPNCALADAYGTMFMALGAERAIEISKEITDAEVYFILSDKSGNYVEYFSEGMEAFLMD